MPEEQEYDTEEHTHKHEHSHEQEHAHSTGESGVAFNHEGAEYVVPLEAAENARLVGATDRIQLPNGQLILLHPRAHEDNANTASTIQEMGGKVWPVE